MRLIRDSLLGLMVIASPVGAFAATQVYTIDPSHTYPSFETSHMGVSYWRGKFDKTSGQAWLDQERGTGKVAITVATGSIDFGLPILDKVVMGSEFFNVGKYPTATFRSEIFNFKGAVPFDVAGEVTLLGITKPITLHVTRFKCIQVPMIKREVCGGDVHAEIDRRQYGMTLGVVPDDPYVRLAIQIEAIEGDTLPQLPGAPPAPGA